MPPLKGSNSTLEEDAKEKAELLQQSFFPQPPKVDLTDPEDYQYHPPIDLPPIKKQKTEAAIRHAPVGTAPGIDDILNHFLHLASTTLLSWLHLIFNAWIELLFPCPFPDFECGGTTVARKR